MRDQGRTLVGLLQMRLALTTGFRRVLPLRRMSRAEEFSVVTFGRASPRVISALIGYFLIQVAALKG